MSDIGKTIINKIDRYKAETKFCRMQQIGEMIKIRTLENESKMVNKKNTLIRKVIIE